MGPEGQQPDSGHCCCGHCCCCSCCPCQHGSKDDNNIHAIYLTKCYYLSVYWCCSSTISSLLSLFFFPCVGEVQCNRFGYFECDKIAAGYEWSRSDITKPLSASTTAVECLWGERSNGSKRKKKLCAAQVEMRSCLSRNGTAHYTPPSIQWLRSGLNVRKTWFCLFVAFFTQFSWMYAFPSDSRAMRLVQVWASIWSQKTRCDIEFNIVILIIILYSSNTNLIYKSQWFSIVIASAMAGAGVRNGNCELLCNQEKRKWKKVCNRRHGMK